MRNLIKHGMVDKATSWENRHDSKVPYLHYIDHALGKQYPGRIGMKQAFQYILNLY